MKEFLGLIVFCMLVFLAALTAASETSIIVVNRIRLKRLASTGSKAAKIILKILESPERFFGTILVANSIAGVLIASISTVAMVSLIKDEGQAVLLATIVATTFIIVSEVAAKTLAAKHSERLSLMMAEPMKALIVIFSPVVKILEFTTNVILKAIGVKTTSKSALTTEEEIRMLMKTWEEEGSLQKDKYKMLSRVFDFSNALVKSVVTPRNSIVSINVKSSFDEIIEKVLESGYSRIPVYKDNPDNIIGIVNMKDLLNMAINKELVVLDDIIYPAVFIPSTKKITELLTEFQKGHTHIAIVLSPANKIEGVVTLEDLLEEIVGEIEDEYDIRPPKVKKAK